MKASTLKIPMGRVSRCGPTTYQQESQYHRVLKLLREGGTEGVDRDVFLFQHRITQVGARISELIEDGCQIESYWKAGHKYVTYRLRSELPADELERRRTIRAGSKRIKQQPLSGSEDWYERASGKPRPKLNEEPTQQASVSGFPLFAETGR